MFDETNEGAGQEAEMIPVDAKVFVTTMAREMKAVLSASPPENGGSPLTEELIRDALRVKQVLKGIDEERLMALVAEPVYEEDIEIAVGKPPVNGQDGTLTYHFDRELSLKPKEQEDGTVDFKELGLIQHVERGQLLLTKTPATDGEDGYDIHGNVLRAGKGRDSKIPAGKNTVLSEDGLQLLAETDGHVEVIGGRVTVLDNYVVTGDVSTATGNINFNGNVTVNGNVLSGFFVQATGNIAIRGSCEAATIKAGGNVTIGEGMNGGTIEAGGEIKSKYLQSSSVTATGNIYVGALMGSNVKSGDSIILTGGKASILGGSCFATNLIESMFIGSENTFVPTHLEVGLDPAVQTRLQEAPGELDQTTALIGSLDQMIDLLKQYEAARRLDNEKKEQLQNALYTREVEGAKQAALIEEIEELKVKAQQAGFGAIMSKGSIYPGVRVVIGPFQMTVKETLTYVRLTRGDDGISVGTAY